MAREFAVPAFVYWLGAPFLLARLAAQRRSGVFKSLERSILDSLIQSSHEPLASALQSQISEINHALRLTTKSSEVNFYKIVGIRPDASRKQPLPVDDGDTVVGEVVGKVDQTIVRAKIFAVNSRLFSIEFNCDARPIINRADLEISTVDVLGKRVFGA